MASAEITKTQVDWVSVSRIVSAKLGRKYAANYCSEVARGRRNSTKLESALKDLGVMQDHSAPTPESQPARRRVAA